LNFVEQIRRREDVTKVYRLGTYRRCSPSTTVERMTPFLGAVGITRIANVTGLDDIGIPVVMVCRPNSRSLSVSQGKGLDLNAARASGLMEAIELFHAENIERPLLFETYGKLRQRARTADVKGLPATARSRFHPNLRLFWIEGYDLLSDEPVWLPNELVNADFRLPRPKGAGCFLHSTNGLAAGNDFLETLIHGICEVIEEDSGTLGDLLSQEQRDKTRVRLNTVEDLACQRVLQTYEDAGIYVAVWNTTTDVGVPSFVCGILPELDNAFRQLYAYGGYGCHPSRNIALLRALLEAAQSRLTFIAGARDDLPRSEYVRHRHRRRFNSFRSQLKRMVPTADFQKVPTFDGRTLNEDLDWLLDRLRHTGIRQVIAVDLSKTKLRIPVVRIAIPFLEGLNKPYKYTPGPRALERLAGKL
jgi:ribosomal protein S12 methylthiotransferase accessory factor